MKRELLSFSFALTILALVPTVSSAGDKFPIYYLGHEDLVKRRLALDPSTGDSDLAQARSTVVQDDLPAPGPELNALKARVDSGMGMLLVLGRHTNAESLKALTDGALEQIGTVDAIGPNHDEALEQIAEIVKYVGKATDPINTNVSWRSAVRMHERSLVRVNRGEVLVEAKHNDAAGNKQPILVRLKQGQGTIYVLTAWIKEGEQSIRKKNYLAMLRGVEDAENYDLQRWAYFNWLLYFMARDAAGVPVANYGAWIAAPVPDRHDVRLLTIIFLTTFAFLVGAFVVARIYSNRHPEALEHLYATPARTPSSLGAAAVPQPTSAKTPSAAHGDPRWEKIGFHRPLSGFLYNYLMALFIVLPLNIGVTFYLERNFVNPFLEARGAWAAVVQFMLFFFTLLDVGTSQAMVKYFAEFRVKEPARAITYAQFFIWFHAIAGIFQITMLGLLSAIWLPKGQAAFLTWFIVLHALIQFPGFISIFFNLFRALQRFDYSQFLIVLTFAMGPVLQMLFAIYMRRWGLHHPVFGEGMGVVFGLAIGGFVNNLLMGLFCALFYRAVGFRLLTIFLAHFRWDTIKRSLIYGIKLTGGQAVAALSWGIVPLTMLILLDDFLELNEIFIVTFALTYAYLETGAYIFTTLMPTISESFSHGKIALTRRYLDQGLRWGLIGCTMLGGAFVAFSDVFVRGLLPAQFARAVAVMALAHIWRAIDFWTRLPDQVFQGVGRTGLFTWTALIEHVSRIYFAWYFIVHYGFIGVFYAFIVSSALKAVVAWPLMNGLVISPAISWWQTIINPLVTAAISYAVLRVTALALWGGPGHVLSAFVAVIVCLFGSLPLYMFISGLLGWDELSMQEFSDAVDLVPKPFGVLARFARYAAQSGTALSPLQGRFPGKIVNEAVAEADALTAVKAELV